MYDDLLKEMILISNLTSDYAEIISPSSLTSLRLGYSHSSILAAYCPHFLNWLPSHKLSYKMTNPTTTVIHADIWGPVKKIDSTTNHDTKWKKNMHHLGDALFPFMKLSSFKLPTFYLSASPTRSSETRIR